MFRGAHTFSPINLFQGYDPEKVVFKKTDVTHRQLKALGKYKSKTALAAKIFFSLIRLIINDMVKTGSSFELPVKSISTLTWKSLQGDVFKRAYVTGKYKELDFLEANFTIFQLIIKYYYRGRFREKDIIPSEDLKAEIINKTNNGFKYC